MAQEEEVEDGHSSREDSIACFTAKTARIQQGTVRRLRQPRTECPELNQRVVAHTYHHQQPYHNEQI
jgi:hypothetical protein